MRRIKRHINILVIAALLLTVTLMPASAAGVSKNISSSVPYDTYIYDYAGNPVITPHAYIPDSVIDLGEMGLGGMTSPSDLEVDKNDNLYLVDTGYGVSQDDLSEYLASLPGAPEEIPGEEDEMVDEELDVETDAEIDAETEEETEPVVEEVPDSTPQEDIPAEPKEPATPEQIEYYNKLSELALEADVAFTGRVIVLNPDKTEKFHVSVFYNTETKSFDGFDNPQGITVTSKYIYVADTGHQRIVRFNLDGSFSRAFGDPNIAYSDEATPYTPTKVAVDRNENMYVISQGEIMGIILLDKEGEFAGYVGAQQVSYSVVDYIWKNILSQEAQDRMEAFVPTEYNNVKIDEQDFLYATTEIEGEDIDGAVMSKTADTKSSPIKRLNPTGNDVLVRKGYFSTVGDVSYKTDPVRGPDISIIVDVALGPNGRYTLLDENYNRMFTYSADGELIYAFSGEGYQVGNSRTPVAIAYDSNYDLYLLDYDTGYITVFSRTKYGKLIDEAYSYYRDYDFENSVKKWDEVLNENANFDIAYDGKGNAYMQDENYDEAMKMFRYSNNKQRYSDALAQSRATSIEDHLIVIVLVVVVILYLLVKLFGWIGKRNKSPKYADKHGTYLNQVLYAFYIMLHPFDGFWDVKHEKRGSVKAATTIALFLIFANLVSAFFTNYLFNDAYGTEISIMSEFLIVLMPLGLWTLCNWCVTTLADGEGSIKDVYVFTCYALLPMAMFTIVNTVLSHFIVLDEGMYITFFSSLGVIWSGFLLFSGNTQTHRYTVSKSVLSILMAAIGMCIVVFIALVIFTTYQQIYGFIDNIVKELTYR